MIYKKIIRPILFLFPPEFVHDFTLFWLGICSKIPFLRNNIFQICNYSSPRLKQNFFGLYFRTPIGLAAGMDKNASAANIWNSFDFGWCQLGSITNLAQAGNKKPRLWRLPQDKGLVINYGLSNIGAQAVLNKLKNQTKSRGLWSISIAKSKNVAMEKATEDYAQSFSTLQSLGDIITINLSCPNVKNFIGLQEKHLLEPIL
ncbi:dihydroorotate dehydrogenase (quinone), partial [bacterium]|nr:dihydroorotate dehydrogenase (quinone) [bacterium]